MLTLFLSTRACQVHVLSRRRAADSLDDAVVVTGSLEDAVAVTNPPDDAVTNSPDDAFGDVRSARAPSAQPLASVGAMARLDHPSLAPTC